MNLQFPYPWADLHIFENGIWNLPKYRVTCSTMIPEHKSVFLCICLSVSLPRKYLPRLRRVFCFHLLLCALGKFCASASHWITSDKDNNFSMKLLEGKKETWHSTSKPQHTCWSSLRYAVRRTGSYFDQGRFKCSRKSSLIPCLFWPVLAKWHNILRRKLDLESDCLCLKFIIAFTYLLVCVCVRTLLRARAYLYVHIIPRKDQRIVRICTFMPSCEFLGLNSGTTVTSFTYWVLCSSKLRLPGFYYWIFYVLVNQWLLHSIRPAFLIPIIWRRNDKCCLSVLQCCGVISKVKMQFKLKLFLSTSDLWNQVKEK